jgi:flagellar hook assembly protein FlgD
VRLAIYNVVGQEIRRLIDDDRSAGNYSVSWDGADNSGVKVSGGIYFCKIVARDHTQVTNLVLLK